MNTQNRLYLFACLLALPYIWPHYFWSLIFFAYSPLISALLHNKVTFSSVTLWYTLFMSLHVLALIVSLAQEEQSLGLLFCLFLTALFIGLQAGVWFRFLSYILSRFYSLFIKVSLLFPGFILFFLYIDRALFWFFGAFQGYSFIHPLLPLVSCAFCIKNIAVLGELYALFVLISCNIFGAYMYQKSKNLFLIVSFILYSIGTFCFCFVYSAKKPLEPVNPIWFTRIAFAQLAIPTKVKTAYATMQEITTLVTEIVQKRPEIEIILFPESTFCYSIYHAPYSLALLTQALPAGKRIVLGAHKQEAEKLFSCCMVIAAHGIASCYDKKKLLFFAEEIPYYFTYFSCLKKLFLGNNLSFSSADKKQEEIIYLNSGIRATPLICSELFLGHKPKYDSDCILALINDQRFSYGPFCDLLYQTAQLKAILWRKPIIYSGYKKSLYIPSY